MTSCIGEARHAPGLARQFNEQQDLGQPGSKRQGQHSLLVLPLTKPVSEKAGITVWARRETSLVQTLLHKLPVLYVFFVATQCTDAFVQVTSSCNRLECTCSFVLARGAAAVARLLSNS